MMCVSALYVLPVKSFFLVGVVFSSSSSSSSGYLTKNTEIRIWGGRVCRRWLEVATTLVAASITPEFADGTVARHAERRMC